MSLPRPHPSSDDQPGDHALTSWRPNDREYSALLEALSRDLAAVEAVKLELDAAGPRPMADVLEAEERQTAQELSDARAARRGFTEAMDDLRSREVGAANGEVPFDSRDPVQNARADLLVQYLVRTGYGEVRSEEPEAGGFIYYFSVKWVALHELLTAQRRGD